MILLMFFQPNRLLKPQRDDTKWILWLSRRCDPYQTTVSGAKFFAVLKQRFSTGLAKHTGAVTPSGLTLSRIRGPRKLADQFC